jgi:23S rRNA (cytosine1962-C5)-methyltransferase
VEFYAKAVSVMKAQRPYLQVSITPKGEAALVKGHPWVYEGEVTAVSG